MIFDATIFGLIVADLIAEPLDLRHPPAPGGLHLARSIMLTTGGNASNVSVAMSKLGMTVAAAGLVGADDLGSALIQRLGAAGVDTSAIHRTDRAQTCATVVAVEPGGERCFFHALGVTALLDADAFRRCFAIFQRSAWVQIGYFGLLPGLTGDLPDLLSDLRAAAPNTRIALDTVNPPAEMALLEPILPHLHLFAPSRPEAHALTGQSDPANMVAAFRRHMSGDALVAIKLGAEGCYLDAPGQATFVPAYPITVVDTTGAGDTWFAGLLTGLRHNMPLDQAGRLANRVAADCCTALGASAGVRSLADTQSRL